MSMTVMVVIVGGISLAAYVAIRRVTVRASRDLFIRGYMFPRGVFEKLVKARPGLDAKEQQLVARALRQFFLAYHKSNYGRVAMPSQVVDDLWHEFILFTRDYQNFCQQAFGRFLHHTPAVRMSGTQRDNEGLRRVWWFSCLEENINPRKATRLPLLFAIDGKLGIGNGFTYQLHCGRTPDEVTTGAVAGTQCADFFSDSGFDGGTSGLGCSGGTGSFGGHGGHGDHGSHGDGGDGCSGGCGGGCGGD